MQHLEPCDWCRDARAKPQPKPDRRDHDAYHLTLHFILHSISRMAITSFSFNGKIHCSPLKNLDMTMAYLALFFLTLWPLVALSFPDRYLAHARDPVITQAPRLDDHSLFARGDVATCGFVSGDAKSPLTCPTSYSCTSTVQDLIGWACCDQIQCAGNYYTCVDYGAQLCDDDLGDAACSSIYTSILSCSSAAPSCFSYARSLSLGAESTYYSLACGQTSGTVLALQTSLGAKSPAAVTGASSTAFGQASPTSSAGSSSSLTSDTSPSSSPPSSSGLSAGEWAGVGVACLAISVAIMVGWWKKHQVLWLVTCGRRGYKKSVKPPRAQGGHPLAYMGNGGSHNVGNGGPNYMGNSGANIMGNGGPNHMANGGANHVGANHVMNVGRWGTR